MTRFVAGLSMPEEISAQVKSGSAALDPNRREFRIPRHVGPIATPVRKLLDQMSSCAQQGRGPSGDNLAIVS